MADLYGGASSSPAAESEEISTFLNPYVHSSVASSSPPPPATAETVSAFPDRRHHGELGSRVGGGNFSGNFSDPGGYFGKEWTEDNVAVSKWRGIAGENDLGDFSRCESEKGVEMPSDTVRPRSSLKRSRAAEVHNLSEKRRRSRINEKMKALQNLIPNSNKTDKASMLDEAIEYLKQLQLQVQMLTLRNGLSLHPMCLPGVLPSMQPPLPGLNFDDGSGLLNSNTLTGAFSANDESLVQTALDLPNQSCVSNQPVAAPSGSNYSGPGTSFSFEPFSQAHYGAFNLLPTPKDICREGTPHVQLDEQAKTSSSSVS